MAKIKYKLPIVKLNNGLCANCGRSTPPCKCGEETNRQCSIHDESCRVLAIPVYATPDGGDRQIVGWVDIAECPVKGCTVARSLKYGQGVDRSHNRKRGRV